MKEIIVNNKEETQAIAYHLGQHLNTRTIITLTGDLGAGKTTFTQGLAKGLGISERVSSPTFTILKEYDSGKLPLYHFDAYRLENGYEDLGFYEYIEDEAVSVIEWPNFMEEDLPKERLEISIYNIDENKRKIIFNPIGVYYQNICKEILS